MPHAARDGVSFLNQKIEQYVLRVPHDNQWPRSILVFSGGDPFLPTSAISFDHFSMPVLLCRTT